MANLEYACRITDDHGASRAVRSRSSSPRRRSCCSRRTASSRSTTTFENTCPRCRLWRPEDHDSQSAHAHERACATSGDCWASRVVVRAPRCTRRTTTLDLVAHQKMLNFPVGSRVPLQQLRLCARWADRAARERQDARRVHAGATLPTTRNDAHPMARRLHRGRTESRDGVLGHAADGFHTDMPFTNMVGNGGLLSTMSDLLKWNENPRQSEGGRPRARRHDGDEDAPDNGRKPSRMRSASGQRAWRARSESQRVDGRLSHVPRALSRAEGERRCALQLGRRESDGLGNVATNVLLARPARVASVTQTGESVSATDLERYVGVFREKNTQQVIRTVVRDGKLMSVQPVAVTFVPLGTDRFRVQGLGELTYHRRGRKGEVPPRR